MTEILTTNSNAFGLTNNQGRVLDYDNAFPLESKGETTVFADSGTESVTIQVITIPCDGVLVKTGWGNASGIGCGKGTIQDSGLALFQYKNPCQFKYKTSVTANNNTYNFYCVIPKSQPIAYVQKGDKFALEDDGQSVTINNESAMNRLIMIPYVGAEIDYNGKVTLKYFDYTGTITLNTMKVTNKHIIQTTPYSEIIKPNDFTRGYVYSVYDKVWDTHCQTWRDVLQYSEFRATKYIFKGWVFNLKSTEPLSESEIYSGTVIKYPTLCALYEIRTATGSSVNDALSKLNSGIYTTSTYVAS